MPSALRSGWGPGTQGQTSEVFPKLLPLQMLRPAQEGWAGPRMRPTELVREAKSHTPTPSPSCQQGAGRSRQEAVVGRAMLLQEWRPRGPTHLRSLTLAP